MDSRTDEKLTDALREYENMRDKTERTYYQNCLVAMGAEVQRLRAKLNVIAFPRRGSPEAGWGVEEIGRFAAEGKGGELTSYAPSGFENAETLSVKDETISGEVDGDSVDKPMRAAFLAAQQVAFVIGATIACARNGMTLDEITAEARRRYPDTEVEASRVVEESGVTDEQINLFLIDVNRLISSDEYGIPLFNKIVMRELRDSVRKWLSKMRVSGADQLLAGLLFHTKDLPGKAPVIFNVDYPNGYRVETNLEVLRRKGESK